MDRITDVVCKPTTYSKYLKLYTMQYTQDGEQKSWDVLNTHDSVVILIYHPKRDSFIFVKQFRPLIYFSNIPPEDRHNEIDVNKYPADLGITIELCAGLVDKTKSLIEIAKEEVLEECGYDVPLENIEKIYSFCTDYSNMSGIQTGFYCEISDDMKVNNGGGIDDERIEVIEMTVSQVKNYIRDGIVRSPTSFLFGIYWFLYNKKR